MVTSVAIPMVPDLDYDGNLFLFAGNEPADLVLQIDTVIEMLTQTTTDDMHTVGRQLLFLRNQDALLRAACVATTREELNQGLQALRTWLGQGHTRRFDTKLGVFLGKSTTEPTIGFMFPGQGSPVYLTGGVYRERFSFVHELYEQFDLSTHEDVAPTVVAQPAIVLASLAGLRILNRLGIKGQVAVGHSLGELTALHWAGGFDEATLLRIASIRGQIMQELGHPTGTMANINTDTENVSKIIVNRPVTIACMNSPRQTVIAGETHAVHAVLEEAWDRGFKGLPLSVSHAFHSPLIAAAVPPFAGYLATESFAPLERTVVSTITGNPLLPDTDIHALLVRQVTEPVRFIQAATEAAQHVDMLIEVGPGHTLNNLAKHFLDVPTVALDACSNSWRGLLHVIGATFTMGTRLIDWPSLSA